MQKTRSTTSRQRAFTIIEVLMVLAVAGLVLLVVFLAVPSVQRQSRNEQRRKTVAQIHAALNEYATANRATYPHTLIEMCDFLDNSGVKGLNPGMEDCSPVLDSSQACVMVRGGIYDICYHIQFSPNDYMGPPGQINIQHGHWCGQSPANAGQYPLADNGTNNGPLNRFAVWTALENSGVACAD